MNKGYLRKAGGHNGRNVVFQLRTIMMRATVRKIINNIMHIKSLLKNLDIKSLRIITTI